MLRARHGGANQRGQIKSLRMKRALLLLVPIVLAGCEPGYDADQVTVTNTPPVVNDMPASTNPPPIDDREPTTPPADQP